MIFKSISIPPRIALLVPLITIAVISIFIWDHLNFCNEEGALRIMLNSVNDEQVSMQVVGAGSRRHRTQRDKIILYAKTDKWYLAPYTQGDAQLRNNCSWSADGLHAGDLYAAYLVRKEYRPPKTIPSNPNANTPPLLVDGNNIIAWLPWGKWYSEQSTAWLSAQIAPNDLTPNALADRKGLIISYHIPVSDEAYPFLYSRSWIYDDALAIIGFTAKDNHIQALTILNAIGGQFEEDGGLGFSYNIENEWYDENYLSGAIAWIGYALVFYQHETGDAQSQAAAERIAHYLLSLQDPDLASPSYGSILSDPNATWYPTSDNIIAYFFLRDLGRLTKDDSYSTGADLIKDSLLNQHWNEPLGRFDQVIGDSGDGLVETNSLGALFLVAIGEIPKARRSLDFVEKNYFVSTVGTASGYAPYKDRTTVWTQASLQMALVYKRLGDIKKR